ncbi:MAG: phosphatidylserine decarboxylase [Epsilonproteobacteria bacterium]|nr:phosphatidylserine decarboxylase [Campylobacterota bacterium]
MLRSHTTTELIAKEGWSIVSFYFILFLVAYALNFLPWVFFVIFLGSIFVYRNFERIPAEDDKMALLSPVDGKVKNISKVISSDGLEYLRLEIRKNILDASLLRSPISATIIETKRVHGLFLHCENELSNLLNERAVMTLKSNFATIVMILKTGFFNKNIEFFKSIGPLKFAQRFGLLLDGSVELLLPIDARIKVRIDDSVRGGESVLGYFSYEAVSDKQ